MDRSDLNKMLDEISQEVVLIGSIAIGISNRFEILCKKMELLKIKKLKRRLENRRQSLAREKGLKLIPKDGKVLGICVGFALMGLVAGGIGKDKINALREGAAGFDGALQIIGDSEWAVSLDTMMTVVPMNLIVAGRTWVTLKSLLKALDALAWRTNSGEQFKSVSYLIAKLKEGKSILEYCEPPITYWYVSG